VILTIHSKLSRKQSTLMLTIVLSI